MNIPTTRLSKLPLLLEPDQAHLLDELAKRLRVSKQALLREAVGEMLAMKGYGITDQVTEIRDALEQALPLAQRVSVLATGQKLWQDKAMKGEAAIRAALSWFPDVKKHLQPKIEFPPRAVKYIMTVGVEFQAVVNGKVRDCSISYEALKDHFGAGSGHASDIARAYIANREAIHEVAKRFLNATHGEVELGTEDFE